MNKPCELTCVAQMAIINLGLMQPLANHWPRAFCSLKQSCGPPKPPKVTRAWHVERMFNFLLHRVYKVDHTQVILQTKVRTVHSYCPMLILSWYSEAFKDAGGLPSLWNCLTSSQVTTSTEYNLFGTIDRYLIFPRVFLTSIFVGYIYWRIRLLSCKAFFLYREKCWICNFIKNKKKWHRFNSVYLQLHPTKVF